MRDLPLELEAQGLHYGRSPEDGSYLIAIGGGERDGSLAWMRTDRAGLLKIIDGLQLLAKLSMDEVAAENLIQGIGHE